MANCGGFHTQIASIMEVLANAAVSEICKLVDDDYAVFRLEVTQSQKENRTLRRKLHLLELKVARERAERTTRERVVASRPSSVKTLDRYRGMARGEGHLTGSHRSFVKPAGHNTWRENQPITVDEAAGPGVKQERTKGEKEPRHSGDIQTREPPVATEDPTSAPARCRTRPSITEVLQREYSKDLQRLLTNYLRSRQSTEKQGPLVGSLLGHGTLEQHIKTPATKSAISRQVPEEGCKHQGFKRDKLKGMFTKCNKVLYKTTHVYFLIGYKTITVLAWSHFY
ncbi:uncharacterized protein isoform X4 [Salmo salar]|uniref:Uncharacterized protein isoform X4 n=1 Tax=Salmo salar TaxID=8030 RepID=A0A1S3REP8_SALSA|nr:uncharacterized protein LOC106602472 isoform X4 [Salmo salar]|eukprot:XP_014050616.1 PREDICTED: uncharacterized protein LOC106602472 isoform X1 [Salmo salar]